MRVETFYFDAHGKQVTAREAVSGEVRQYDDRDRLILRVHLESVDEDGRRRWHQVRALGSARPAPPRPDVSEKASGTPAAEPVPHAAEAG